MAAFGRLFVPVHSLFSDLRGAVDDIALVIDFNLIRTASLRDKPRNATGHVDMFGLAVVGAVWSDIIALVHLLGPTSFLLQQRGEGPLQPGGSEGTSPYPLEASRKTRHSQSLR